MDACALLTSQGWRGKGHSLHQTDDSIGLAKPLLLNRKDNTKGLGTTAHFTSDQWWMNAFDEQLKGLQTSKEGGVTQTVTTGKLNAVDRGSLGKYSLYASFVRGGFLEGTALPGASPATATAGEATEARRRSKEEKALLKAARRRSKEEKTMLKAARMSSKEEKDQLKAARRRSKEEKTLLKAARMSSEEEKALLKAARREARASRRHERLEEQRKARTDEKLGLGEQEADRARRKQERRARREAKRAQNKAEACRLIGDRA
ncbi:uncharacterized protein UV8b_05726 [Ustilaginoidea virens]|uniref:DNA-directed RNA polymerase II subunit RPB1 n=1 Tax=Ustilaginoidea virens TaxID=1159556 RepID=A0A8E5MIE3_USTVR|nr:uncharacterized protein UV8b_05726 [Ustilaginoidea virens]QUC21483.1 hypothetical protein UV8b_05726 [Ustilaginoidea virens]